MSRKETRKYNQLLRKHTHNFVGPVHEYKESRAVFSNYVSLWNLTIFKLVIVIHVKFTNN